MLTSHKSNPTGVHTIYSQVLMDLKTIQSHDHCLWSLGKLQFCLLFGQKGEHNIYLTELLWELVSQCIQGDLHIIKC